jgi:hypothetical protein
MFSKTLTIHLCILQSEQLFQKECKISETLLTSILIRSETQDTGSGRGAMCSPSKILKHTHTHTKQKCQQAK